MTLKTMTMRVELQVGWQPIDPDPNKKHQGALESTKAVFERDIEFLQRPVAGEVVKIGGEFFHIAQFYHDTDAGCLRVCLRQDWRHTTADAQARIAELKAAGWEWMNADQFA